MKQDCKDQKCDATSKKVRKGDTVMVMRGESRGRMGVVLSIKDDTVLVQGINVRKKHMKATQANPKGSIVELEKPVHISNVTVCVDGKPVKLRTRQNNNGERELYYLNEGQAVTYRSIKKQ